MINGISNYSRHFSVFLKLNSSRHKLNLNYNISTLIRNDPNCRQVRFDMKSFYCEWRHAWIESHVWLDPLGISHFGHFGRQTVNLALLGRYCQEGRSPRTWNKPNPRRKRQRVGKYNRLMIRKNSSCLTKIIGKYQSLFLDEARSIIIDYFYS